MARPASGHMKMDRKNRAKQFAPFDALRGFGEAIREKGVLYTERPVLCEDKKEELEKCLSGIKEGDCVTVIYFKECPKAGSKGLFETVTGNIALSKEDRCLCLENLKIRWEDIVDITI